MSPPSRLRERAWTRFLSGPDPRLLSELYEPALACARRYDRCCAYFSSSALAAAAAGFGPFIERLLVEPPANPPAVRLLVNEELQADDVRALMERRDDAPLGRALLARFGSARDALERDRLSMLAWLAREGWLQIRVGVMRTGRGILHGKFGIIADGDQDALVFAGSGNESASGLRRNYEKIEVTTSWQDSERHTHYVDEFEALWKDEHPDVHSIPLPEAVRQELIRYAPEEPPVDEPTSELDRQRAAMLWRFIVEAPYLANGETACDGTAQVACWPHQGRVVQEVAAAWPDGRLLCDEVGMGKTVEAILALRRLLAGRGVRRALLLTPANLLKQWQAELREKGGLVVPRLDGPNLLVWPDGRSERPDGFPQALQQNLLLMSRETARTENNLPHLLAAEPWDLVLLDEAHAARRAQQVEGEFNAATLLLGLLRQLQLRGVARSLMLLSATPMQTHPWEPWDLLQVLGEGGVWLSTFDAVRRYYHAVSELERGRGSITSARAAAAILTQDGTIPPPPAGLPSPSDSAAFARALAFAPSEQRPLLARWLRQASPLARRMHRNTRETLRRYYQEGLIDRPPPRRIVEDRIFDFQHLDERRAYDAVEGYINRRFDELERERPGKGFVMTVYRRRAASSPHALRLSLERRAEGLRAVIAQRSFQDTLDGLDDFLDLEEFREGEVGRITAALPQEPRTAARELREVENLLGLLDDLRGLDSKREFLFDEVRRATADGRAALIFTCYADTMEYLRQALAPMFPGAVASYSGDGGALMVEGVWRTAAKEDVTAALRAGLLRIVVCTDAASEGLNLQAAGAVINFDLPWNPSKVEQRIGRVDRIGQALDEIRVANLFLRDSVDERVYMALRTRCRLFEQFVGPMQPVLALARRLLLGHDDVDLDALDRAANEVDADPLVLETFREATAQNELLSEPVLTRDDIAQALDLLDPGFGPSVASAGDGLASIEGIAPLVALSPEALARTPKAIPLDPMQPDIRSVADALTRPGERLPLVVAAAERGAFRRSLAIWVEDGEAIPVTSVGQLRELAHAWSGSPPDPALWISSLARARATARLEIDHMAARARDRQALTLERQRSAARLRLQFELGRYLVCAAAEAQDLNAELHRQMQAAGGTAQKLRLAFDRLGGYPNWTDAELDDLRSFRETLQDSQVRGRLIGKELDAAFSDPRWSASIDL